MNDFNLRPEVVGFGRPERLLKAEAAPAPVPPIDAWKARGDGFEVNGLGQLRTVLALPASEGEIAANMRHVDAAPIARRYSPKSWVGVDPGAADGDQTAAARIKDGRIEPVPFPVKQDPALETLMAGIDAMKHAMLFGDFSGLEARIVDRPEFQALEKQRNAIFKEMVKAAALQVAPPMMFVSSRQVGKTDTIKEMLTARGLMDAQAVPQEDRHVLGGDRCQCAGCVASSLGGRFSSTAKVMADLPQRENYTARYMAMSDAEMIATRHVPQECDEDGEAFRRELRIRGL